MMVARWLVALTWIFLAMGDAFAQPPAEQAPETRAVPREKPEDSRKLLEEVLMARLTKELALDEGQSVILVRHLAEHREKMAALRRERAQLVRSLREAVRESKDEARITTLLAEVNMQDEKIAAARSEFQEFSSLELTAWQRARLYLFVQDFESDMRRLLKRAQERRHALGNRRDGQSPPEKRRAGDRTDETPETPNTASESGSEE